MISFRSIENVVGCKRVVSSVMEESALINCCVNSISNAKSFSIVCSKLFFLVIVRCCITQWIKIIRLMGVSPHKLYAAMSWVNNSLQQSKPWYPPPSPLVRWQCPAQNAHLIHRSAGDAAEVNIGGRSIPLMMTWCSYLIIHFKFLWIYSKTGVIYTH